MKKWLAGIPLLIILFTVAVYIVVPGTIVLNRQNTANITQDGINRTLINNNDWSRWWPGKISSEKDPRRAVIADYKNNIYGVIGREYGSLSVTIKNNHFTAATNLVVIPIGPDSMLLTWKCNIPTSYNPIKRMQVYFAANNLTSDIDAILNNIQRFFSRPENIYRINIQHALVTDSFLVSSYTQSKIYPTPAYTYALINKLKNYIASQSAKETGFPMLNIIQQDSAWMTRVAIPTDKKLNSSGDISFKEMLGRGNILVAEVQGGPETIKNAMAQMENYVNDYHFSAPAIPFQSLVTDRTKEDSSKWITRIYHPIM